MPDVELKVKLLGFYAHMGESSLAVAQRAYDWILEQGKQTQEVMQGHPSEPTSAVVPPPCDITGQADGALLRRRKGGIPPEDLALLKRLREEGLTNAEIGKRLGMHPNNVCNYVRKHGLEKRPSGASRKAAAGAFLDVYSLDSPPAGTSPARGAFSKPTPAIGDEEKVQEFLKRKGVTTQAHYGKHHDVFVLMKGWGFGYVPASAKRFVVDPITGAQLRIDDFFAMCRKECERRNHALPASLAEKSRRAAK